MGAQGHLITYRSIINKRFPVSNNGTIREPISINRCSIKNDTRLRPPVGIDAFNSTQVRLGALGVWTQTAIEVNFKV